MASVNKVILINKSLRKNKHTPIVDHATKEQIVEMYLAGLSIPIVANAIGVSRSTARYHVKGAGALRTRAQAIKMAANEGRLGSGLRGKKRVFTQAHKEAIKNGRTKWGEEKAKGVSLKPNGYIEITRGNNKGKSVHVSIIERRIGRSLLDDEVVHHIDGNKQNNDINNLSLCTRSGHARLHRFEDRLSGNKRQIREDGTWL